MKDREKSCEFSRLKVNCLEIKFSRIISAHWSSVFKSDKFGGSGEPGRNARPARIGNVRSWMTKRRRRGGNGCALICRNHEERWQTTMTQFPDSSLSELAHPARARVSIMSPPRCYNPLRARSYFSLFIYILLRNRISEKFQEKNQNLGWKELSSTPPFPLSPSFRATSSAKCPTKIGICREY